MSANAQSLPRPQTLEHLKQRKLDLVGASLITTQLRMAFAVTLFTVTPLVLSHFELADDAFWQVASGLYLFGMVYLWNQGNLIARNQDVALKPPKLAMAGGISAVALLGFNLWLADAWPYVLQLVVAWTASMFLYLGFIQDALNRKVETDRDMIED